MKSRIAFTLLTALTITSVVMAAAMAGGGTPWAGEALAAPYTSQTIHAKLNGIPIPPPCGDPQWHFIINQLSNQSLAPGSITINWNTGGHEVVPLDNVNSSTAHYLSGVSAPGVYPVDVTAVIYDGWSGQFVYSHNTCPAPTPTNTPVLPTPTNTTVPTSTPTPTNTPVPIDTPTPTNTSVPASTATPTATTAWQESTATPTATTQTVSTVTPTATVWTENTSTPTVVAWVEDTATPTVVAWVDNTVTPTQTRTPAPTNTAVPTATEIPNEETPTFTPVNTPVQFGELATPMATATQVPAATLSEEEVVEVEVSSEFFEELALAFGEMPAGAPADQPMPLLLPRTGEPPLDLTLPVLLGLVMVALSFGIRRLSR